MNQHLKKKNTLVRMLKVIDEVEIEMRLLFSILSVIMVFMLSCNMIKNESIEINNLYSINSIEMMNIGNAYFDTNLDDFKRDKMINIFNFITYHEMMSYNNNNEPYVFVHLDGTNKIMTVIKVNDNFEVIEFKNHKVQNVYLIDEILNEYTSVLDITKESNFIIKRKE